MGVKKIMETFFEGMQDQSMSGFGGKLVNTPMGPFRWNDTLQLWENVNNGMLMNNISFQDSIFMMDYSTASGDNGNMESNNQPILTNSFGNITGMTVGGATRWSSINGPQAILLNGSAVTFSNVPTPILLRAISSVTQGTGQNLQTIFYSINGATGITSGVGGFTISNGDLLRLAGRTPNDLGLAAGATGNIILTNLSAGGNTLATITWSYQYPLPIEP